MFGFVVSCCLVITRNYEKLCKPRQEVKAKENPRLRKIYESSQLIQAEPSFFQVLDCKA